MFPPTPHQQQLRVLIVGCGAIAGGYDADRPADAAPFTHAGAFTRDGRFRIDACVDPDERRRAAFMHRWDVPRGVAAVEELADEERFDIVSICSPTAHHAHNVDAALRLRPRLIFCEKPIAPATRESEKLLRRCEERGVMLAVNHTRRWAPDVVRLREELASGRWGAVRSVVGIYGKGIVHNGAHLVDLLHFLLDVPLEIVAVGAPVYDHWPEDPTVPALLRAGEAAVHLVASDARDFAAFEVQLITAQAIIAIEGGGLAWRARQAVDSMEFSGYRTLDRGRLVAGDYADAMLHAVANIHDALTSGAALSSTGHSALAAQRVCDRVRAMAAGQEDQDE